MVAGQQPQKEIKGGGEKQWEVEKEKDIQIQIDVIHETARVPIGCTVHVKVSE